MTNLYSSYRRNLKLLPFISLLSFLAACGTPDGGYYDANGNWIATDTIHKPHAPLPGGTRDYNAAKDRYDHTKYDRPGYYDRNGYYISRDDGFNVPENMFPQRGMCRVWFTERPASEQPPVESCNGIKSRVPAGAYIIFGG
ncbi:MAG: hypothetical protein SFX19_05335 [Alphaproteobacteria bacterium]|nr:hypothetical protein [Alphaproteobacteria bacterium]